MPLRTISLALVANSDPDPATERENVARNAQAEQMVLVIRDVDPAFPADAADPDLAQQPDLQRFGDRSFASGRDDFSFAASQAGFSPS